MKFENFLSAFRATSKPKKKRAILKEYDSELLQFIIHASYEPFNVYHVNIKKDEIPEPGDHDLIELEIELRDVIAFCLDSKSNKQNRERVVKLLAKLNKGSQDLLIGILNKNWKVGLGVRNILKIFPGIVSRFDVQLANTYKPDNDKHTIIPRWILSNKLDGLRCIALRESSDKHYDKGRWTLYTRKGKEFLTVEHLKAQLEKLYEIHGWTFFDGELYKHGLSFEAIQGLTMGFTRGQAPEIEYHVFIAGDAEKFLTGDDPNHVDPLGGPSEDYAPSIHFVNDGWCASIEIYTKLEEAFEQGYEGIMLRDPDHLYDYKRSNALLKLKQGQNAGEGEIISDCVVISIDYDDFPVIEDGQMHHEKLLVRVWVRQEDGTECKVGSGFDLNFRRRITNAPWLLLNKTVEIKHQQWGSNGRMRFPRLWRVREDL
jgi:DNA ligase-1